MSDLRTKIEDLRDRYKLEKLAMFKGWMEGDTLPLTHRALVREQILLLEEVIEDLESL